MVVMYAGVGVDLKLVGGHRYVLIFLLFDWAFIADRKLLCLLIALKLLRRLRGGIHVVLKVCGPLVKMCELYRLLLKQVCCLHGVWVPGFELNRDRRSTNYVLFLKIVAIVIIHGRGAHKLIISARITANNHIRALRRRSLLVSDATFVLNLAIATELAWIVVCGGCSLRSFRVYVLTHQMVRMIDSLLADADAPHGLLGDLLRIMIAPDCKQI